MPAEVEHEKPNTQQLTQHDINIQGATIHVVERGTGAALMFLHGSPDTHAMWLPLMEHIPSRFRCLAPDLPGFGASSLPRDFSLELDNMADVVKALATALGIDAPLTLVTTDFGGHYGMAFAVKYPDLLKGIVISNTNFFSSYEWHSFAKLYRTPIIGEILVRTATRSTLGRTLKRVAPALPDDYIEDSYDTGFGSKSVRKTILRMYRERDAKDFVGWEDKLLALLKAKPALVLWGDKDPFITPNYAERFEGAQIHHFETFSHWLPLEAPDAYAGVLVPWLESL